MKVLLINASVYKNFKGVWSKYRKFKTKTNELGTTKEQIFKFQEEYSDEFGITAFISNVSKPGEPPIYELLPKGVDKPSEDEFKERFWKNTDDYIKENAWERFS